MAGLTRLLHAAKAGDQRAWDALVDRYSGLVWSIARAHRLSAADAADVSQTTWLLLAEHLDRITNPEAVGGWLATTARRESLRVLRVSARALPSGAGEFVPDRADAGELDSALLTSERNRMLWRAFGAIPERCQRLLRVLMADPPPSYQDVAQALEMPVGSIGPTRGRCLETLRAELARVGIDREAAASIGEEDGR
jgi:RNA polymerase sigma factor (sigma-70 family)